jgi:hypothetical protein
MFYFNTDNPLSVLRYMYRAMKLLALALAATLLPACLANAHTPTTSTTHGEVYGILVSVKGYDLSDEDKGYTSIGYNVSTATTYDTARRVCIGLASQQNVVTLAVLRVLGVPQEQAAVRDHRVLLDHNLRRRLGHDVLVAIEASRGLNPSAMLLGTKSESDLYVGAWVSKFRVDVNRALTISSTYINNDGSMEVAPTPPVNPGGFVFVTLAGKYNYFGLNYSYHGVC